ncbi:retinol binding protein receptor-domain-containing protein, partial [Umbelopsis sp. PMI_123]
LLNDGGCLSINDPISTGGWKTFQSDDWIYYPQQQVNISLNPNEISVDTVGGCCAPNPRKQFSNVYYDDGSTYNSTGDKIVGVVDAPMIQNIYVQGWYMQSFVDNASVNLTLLPSMDIPDKESIVIGTVIDRAMIITYQFLDADNLCIANRSSGVLRNQFDIPDITLPPKTRTVVSKHPPYNIRTNPMCFSYIYAGIYVDMTRTSVVNIPLRFLCRQPCHPILLCLFIMIGSFIFNGAWNLVRSQSNMFDSWLPRAMKIIEFHRSRLANIFGFYISLCLLCLRISIDLPYFVITYARESGFLALNVLMAVVTLAGFLSTVIYFLRNAIRFEECELCQTQFLDPGNTEENYVRELLKKKFRRYITNQFGLYEHIRVPLVVKASLVLLIYCQCQLIVILMTELLGVGGFVPRQICSVAAFASKLQTHSNAMQFALETFTLMQVAIYVAGFGAGTCFTGTLYFMVEISLIGTAITLLVELDVFRHIIFHRVTVGIWFSSFFVSLVVQLIQRRITLLIFVENRTRMAVQNRAPFMHYCYFLMFTAMTRALTSYLLRTIKLLFRYPIFSIRVDRNAETWGVRRGDAGFVAYCGMILAEHEYNNPIILSFITSLVKREIASSQSIKRCRKHQAKFNDTEPGTAYDGLKEAYKSNEQKRARTRWFLAVSLINNPMLRKVRMASRQAIMKEDTEEIL